MRTAIYIGEWRVDQQAQESVDVVSSVLDITNITKNTGDYTKTFTVPASKRNNILFKHWYDATIDNSFDARIRVEGRIEIDGFLFKKGKFRLSKVSVKKGAPSNYTINFFGNLPSLKDIVKKDLLSDLNLTNFDHDYDSANVRAGLRLSNFFQGDIIYTLLAKKRYFYNDNVNDNTQLDSIANIADGGGEDTGVVWNDLRASIRLLKILEAIETDYDITFSRNFFGTTEFTSLYMWLNPDKSKQAGGELNVIDWDSGSSFYMNLSTNIGSYTVFDTPSSNDSRNYKIFCTITPEPLFTEVAYTIIAEIDGEDFLVTEFNDGGVHTQTLNLNPDGEDDTTKSVKWKVLSEQEFQYTARLTQIEHRNNGTIINEAVTNASLQINESIFKINEELPKIKIIDFLKGLFNMFKLVIVAKDDGTYFVDTLDSFYATGNTYDVTRYIDFKSYDVERGVILNEIELKFKEPTTLLNIQFEKDNNRFYGDIEKVLTDEQDSNGNEIGELLDGDSLTFELPFEQIVYERLNDQESGDLTSVQYGAIIDENLEPANPKAHIYYNIATHLGGKTIAFIDDTGVRSTISGYINTPYHQSGVTNPNYSTIFNREFSTWDGVAIEKTLYKNHYDTYVRNIFNIKKRSFKYSAQLPVHIITKLELNDTLKIKNTYYRIDKYSYNLLTSKTAFNLINNFDSQINPLSTRNDSVYVDFEDQTYSIVINNTGSFAPTVIDQGSGTDWITLGVVGDSLDIIYDENSSDAARGVFIQYVSGADTINIYTQQDFKKPTFDSTTITFDSTKLTFDNT